MADINFNFKSDDIEKLNKLFAELLKMTEQIKTNVASTGTFSKATSDDAKRNAAEAKKLTAEIDKQNRILSEQKGIIGGLEAESRRWKTELKKATDTDGIRAAQREIERINTELVKAKGNTNTWEKALGSFQFKFNALGNIASTALAGISSRLTDAITQFISFEKVIRSTQGSSDSFDKSIAGLRGSFDYLAKAVASGNLTDFFKRLGEATNAAMAYAVATDEIGDRTNAVNVKVSQLENTIADLRKRLKEDSKYTVEERKKFADEIFKLSKQMLDSEVKLGEDSLNALTAKFQGFSRLTSDEQIKFISEYENNIEMIRDVEKKLGSESFLLEYSKTHSQSVIDAVFGEPDEVKKIRTELAAINDQYKDNSGFAEWVNLYSKANLLTDEDRKGLADAVIKVNNLKAAYSKGLIRVTGEYEALLKEILKTNKKKLETDNTDIINIRYKVDAMEDLKTATEEYLALFNKPDLFAGINDASDELARIDEENLAKKEGNFNDYIKGIEDADSKTKQRMIENAIKVSQAIGGTFNSLSDIYEVNKQKELSAAGDNAIKREEIERKYAKKQQQMAIGEATIAMSIAILNAMQTKPFFPMGLIMAGLAATSGGIQLAAIKAQKFEDGGEVGGKRHSQGGTHIEAEVGEYVINRNSTRKYKGLIEGINDDNQAKIMNALHQDRRISIVSRDSEYTRKLYELMKEKEVYGETKDFYVIHKGTKTTKIHKN